jgi:hypothetical protein
LNILIIVFISLHLWLFILSNVKNMHFPLAFSALGKLVDFDFYVGSLLKRIRSKFIPAASLFSNSLRSHFIFIKLALCFLKIHYWCSPSILSYILYLFIGTTRVWTQRLVFARQALYLSLSYILNSCVFLFLNFNNMLSNMNFPLSTALVFLIDFIV